MNAEFFNEFYKGEGEGNVNNIFMLDPEKNY